MATNRLYYESSYLKAWETSVVETVRREGGWYVRLAETAFYPHGGGQPCDEGTINGVRVLDVSSDDDEVWHKVERPIEGTAAACRIDWERRFDHMQQHSGQHLLSAVCLRLYGAPTVGFHMGVEAATIDVERSEFTREELARLEREVNQAIYDDRRIASYIVSEAEALHLPLVKPPSVSGQVRIVEIDGVEYNACGGTHVAATGAIGMIKLLRTEKTKNNVRITFKCGNRSLAEFNDCAEIVGKLVAKFNAGKGDLVARIGKWEQEQKRLLAEIDALKAENDAFVARELLERNGDRLVAHAFDQKPLKDLQGLATKLATMTEAPILLAGLAEGKVVIAHGGRSELSCGAFCKEHLGEFRGKGGGSAVMAQAGFETSEDARGFYDFVKQVLG